MKEESANPPEPDSEPAKSGRQFITVGNSIAQLSYGSQTRTNHTKKPALVFSIFVLTPQFGWNLRSFPHLAKK